RLQPRPMSQPWLSEAVGTAEWTGTPLAPILKDADVRDGARDVVFTGLDRGVQGGVDQHYERSLSIADAMRDEVLLAYAINGRPLPPQHGFPLRLIVPGWYGMTHVKWLRSITVIDRPFAGYQRASTSCALGPSTRPATRSPWTRAGTSRASRTTRCSACEWWSAPRSISRHRPTCSNAPNGCLSLIAWSGKPRRVRRSIGCSRPGMERCRRARCTWLSPSALAIRVEPRSSAPSRTLRRRIANG